MSYKQNQPLATLREVVFHLSDSATGLPVTGATFSGAEIQIRKPGAVAYVNANAGQQTAVVEIGGGDYVYTATVAEFDTAGPGFALKVNKAGSLLFTNMDEIVRAFFFKSITGTLGASSFTTDRTEATTDFWKDVLVLSLDGANVGQVKKIGAYNGASKLMTLATGLAFAAAPSNGDNFEIIDR
jgi:hypothetical protein